MKFLIYGKGYIGEHYFNFLSKQEGDEVMYGKADIGNIEQVRQDLAAHEPDVVLNCAGKTGRPNVDWCETHKDETLYANVTGPLILAKACSETESRLVHLGSGCIYEGDNNGKGYSEDDTPNFTGSFYSRTKIWSEQVLREFPVLILRLRMPIDADNGPRNFITKILKYDKIISVPNSMTVIEDLLTASYELVKQGKTGIYNMTNPGVIDHETIMELYKKIVDPNHTYTVMSLDELYDKYASAKRSNCMLSTTKLESEGIQMRPIKDAIRDCLERGFKNTPSS